jgi:hypothetical protein
MENASSAIAVVLQSPDSSADIIDTAVTHCFPLPFKPIIQFLYCEHTCYLNVTVKREYNSMMR